ncbi:uncharacterized protein LOC143601784 [Bidens hawaiensis]|uniref:uncharacterized protein LOC143601784 n=1 Tax=Bidens hawaiensis TaxID=980011 RepID=UPI00404B8BBF
MKVSNSFGSDVSRVFINDYLFEIDQYKNRLFGLLNGNDVNIRRPIPVRSLSSLDDEFLKTSFYNISEICTTLLPKSIIFLETIKAICPDTDWYYIGCSNCSRKLVVNVVEGGIRYKIKIRVQDSTGVVSLTLFDRDAKLLIKKPASDLIVAKYEPSDSDSIISGASVSELQSSGSLSVKLSDIGDNQTPSSNVDDHDETNNYKGSVTSSDDKLKRKLVDVFEDDDESSMLATKFKALSVEDKATTSHAIANEGVTLLTPIGEGFKMKA